MIAIKSIFEQISTTVFTMKNLNEVKEYVKTFVKDKDINEKDKQSILREVDNAKSLVKFQQYICNALLKYEGMGMNKINKPKDHITAIIIETEED
ncbi:MAG: hypothetical protein BWY22_02542 [Bacteroidetes bacterium ADurb.Bin217]|nr:MAG: hypothetical protein BWY22_02542 [Bacteroidetes bacterium ADurb.Bin217]